MTIDVRRLAEEAGLDISQTDPIPGANVWEAYEHQLTAFANLVLEAAALQAEETICGSNDYGEIYGENAADAIRALKVKP